MLSDWLGGAVFQKISGNDEKIDIEELVRWIPRRRKPLTEAADAESSGGSWMSRRPTLSGSLPTVLPQLARPLRPSVSLPTLHHKPAESARKGPPADAFAGRGLAARWLMPKASSRQVEAIVDVRETLPLSLMDTWFVLPDRWHSLATGASPPRKQPKPTWRPATVGVA